MSRRFNPATEKFMNQSCPYSHSIIKPPEKATKMPEKWMNEAVIVRNWKYNKSKIIIKLIGQQ